MMHQLIFGLVIIGFVKVGICELKLRSLLNFQKLILEMAMKAMETYLNF
jgi:hypothetical protein